MKTKIKYAHGKGFSKNLSSVTIIAGARTSPDIQENIAKARARQNSREQAHQLF
ncbi:hypothetical protein [Sporomusa acidovorans]|uniref:Uncharacterized protein n=1 Tax=Sporomusa acidovorans (strain ATCC 49682 / DSM 3132 / Mol) TaxID=1123286 RepID=A0ABZ3JAH2_SPOA4|nr:hypothetical protein [Sporomusa acidovorans]OZC21832.1 hypothetical protein SPACI_19070 [Sporomusa acidovorans DSM 3132]SDD55544.1 hypothetical protein SAMN04488499_100226 [Sporomusa acidovorans]